MGRADILGIGVLTKEAIMEVRRAYFKTCDDIPDIRNLQGDFKPIDEYGFETYLDLWSERFFGKDRFDFAVWGAYKENTWNYTAYHRDGFRLRASQTKGDIEFTHRVTGGSHGNVPFQAYRDTFLGGPMFKENRPILTDIANPLFSVVDHNSAHHMAYILANKGFRGHEDMAWRRVVINFDNHKDYEAFNPDADSICCQNWGQALRPRPDDKTLHRDHPVSRYVVLGLGSTIANVVSWGLGGIRYQDKVDLSQEILLANALRKSLELGVPLENYLFHITVDRDFMKGSYTPYGDGPHYPHEGRNMVLQCLHFLKQRGATLSGFDVTGLPCGSSVWFNTIVPVIYARWVADNPMSESFMREHRVPVEYVAKVHRICDRLSLPRRPLDEETQARVLIKIQTALAFDQLCDDVRCFYDAVLAY
ncbi:hypothetical protein MSL71_30040 [Desulfoluna butyratoxydans]|uniref:Uncharacterized protein n=2 Tax=Desulfoluna butyratoxydans TaxID=231438 RepID=A0A4U8YPH3_9BACT|nr:hypothetical protein MSL71_30040 [Desulfoluna butyratoxydans]